MSESKKPFTVKDRRHFTPEGVVREEPEDPAEAADEGTARSPEPRESPERPAPGAAPEAAADSQTSGGTTGERSTGPETSRPTSSAPRTGRPGAQDAGPADFAEFLLSLGAQAGMLLGGQGLPEGADAGEALAGSRSIISILEMLQEKTEGRRTSQEDQVLEGLLFELRMAYVEKSRAGGS